MDAQVAQGAPILQCVHSALAPPPKAGGWERLARELLLSAKYHLYPGSFNPTFPHLFNHPPHHTHTVCPPPSVTDLAPLFILHSDLGRQEEGSSCPSSLQFPSISCLPSCAFRNTLSQHHLLPFRAPSLLLLISHVPWT